MSKTQLDQDTQSLLEAIGQRIREYRKAKGMSQEDLANTADIDLTYMGYVENGKHNVSVGKLYAISKALDIEMTELF